MALLSYLTISFSCWSQRGTEGIEEERGRIEEQKLESLLKVRLLCRRCCRPPNHESLWQVFLLNIFSCPWVPSLMEDVLVPTQLTEQIRAEAELILGFVIICLMPRGPANLTSIGWGRWGRGLLGILVQFAAIFLVQGHLFKQEKQWKVCPDNKAD